MIVLLAGVAVLLLVGAVLLKKGLRGAPIDDHPLCRACGFDLAGLNPAASRERCPECGGAINSEGRIVRGNRRPNRRQILAGAACLSLGLIAGVPIVAALLGGTRVHRYTPIWLLVLQAELRTDAHADEVLKELLARHMTRPLSDPVLARLGARAARVQEQELARPGAFSAEWRQFLEDPAVIKSLPAALRSEVKQRGGATLLAARRRITAGQPLPLRYGLDTDTRFLFAGSRAGKADNLKFEIRDPGGAVVLEFEHPVRSQFRTAARGIRYWNNMAIPLDLKPGSYELQCVGRVTISTTGPNWGLVPSPDDPVLTSTIRQPLEILSPGERSSTAHVDAGLAAAMRKQLTVSLSASPYSQTQTWIGVGMGVMLDGPSAPLSAWLERPENVAAYRVTAQRVGADGAPAIELGHCTVDIQSGVWSFLGGGAAVDSPTLGIYRLVLKPDLDYAETLVDCERILDGELVYEGIELR